MNAPEPTTAELLAAAVGLALAARALIAATDRANRTQCATTLDALHHHLAAVGGSLLELAERLDCEAEVKRRVSEGQARLAAYAAFQGTEGRA